MPECLTRLSGALTADWSDAKTIARLTAAATPLTLALRAKCRRSSPSSFLHSPARGFMMEMIPFFTGSESGYRITEKLKIDSGNRCKGQKHNTLIGVTIPIFIGAES